MQPGHLLAGWQIVMVFSCDYFDAENLNEDNPNEIDERVVAMLRLLNGRLDWARLQARCHELETPLDTCGSV